MKNVVLDTIEVPEKLVTEWTKNGLLQGVEESKVPKLALIYQYVSYFLIHRFHKQNQKHNLKQVIYAVFYRIYKHQDINSTKEIETIISNFIKHCDTEKPKLIHKIRKPGTGSVLGTSMDWEYRLVAKYVQSITKKREDIRNIRGLAEVILPF